MAIYCVYISRPSHFTAWIYAIKSALPTPPAPYPSLQDRHAQALATLLSKVKPDGTLLGIIQVGNLNIASLDTVVKTLVSSTPTFQSLYPSK